MPVSRWLIVVAMTTVGVTTARAQSRPAVTMYQVPPERAADKLAALMATYGFKVESSGKKRLVLWMDRGTVAQPLNTPAPTGPIKVFLEVVINLKQQGDSLTVTVVEETLVGIRGPGLEQRKPQDLRKNYDAHMTTLNQAKRELEVPPADSSVAHTPPATSQPPP